MPDELEASGVTLTPDAPDPPADAPDELEPDSPISVGDPEAPEPDDAVAPEPPELDPLDPLDPKPVGAPLLALDPLAAVLPAPEELSPLVSGLPVAGPPVTSDELPQPAAQPISPHRIAKVFRQCMAFLHPQKPMRAKGLKVAANTVSRQWYVRAGKQRPTSRNQPPRCSPERR
jgi:hypothetical protein